MKLKAPVPLRAWALVLTSALPLLGHAHVEEGAAAADWPTFGGTTRAWRYSALAEVNVVNVHQLVPAWLFQTGDYAAALQSTPIVADGVMYLSTASDQVFALDAATGEARWHYKYAGKLPPGVIASNRGVAVGPDLVYLGTWDSAVVALDRRTGRQVWKITVDTGSCVSCAISAAPLLAGDKLIVGVGGGDRGFRGYLTALDARTGRFAWRFYVTPGPGEPGHDTWKGDSWKTGGGGTWTTGSYDPKWGLIYWSTGNPAPDLSAETRDPGRADRRQVNLYTDSVVALDPATGALQWSYQLIPNDVWDYDAAAECVLIERLIEGRKRQLLIHVGKSGVATVLDRTNGQFIRAFPAAELVTWVDHIGTDGEPVGRREPKPDVKTNICPGPTGAKSWNQLAYSPRSGLIYVPLVELCADYTALPQGDEVAAGSPPGFGGITNDAMPDGRMPFGHVDAYDVATGKRVWTHRSPSFAVASVLATAGNLVFSGDAQGNFFALDAHTGHELWSFQTGAGLRSSAVAYSVAGREYIATATGFPGLVGGRLAAVSNGLEYRVGSTLVVFALPKEAARSAPASPRRAKPIKTSLP